MEKALFDDQSASDNLLADMLAQTIDRAIGFPGDVRVKFQRMTAGRVAQKLFFPAQPLQMIRFSEGDGGKTVEIFGGKEGELVKGRVSRLRSELRRGKLSGKCRG